MCCGGPIKTNGPTDEEVGMRSGRNVCAVEDLFKFKTNGQCSVGGLCVGLARAIHAYVYTVHVLYF